MVLSTIDDIDQQAFCLFLEIVKQKLVSIRLGTGRGVDRGTVPRGKKVEAQMEL
jgi:hypothetical protein